MHQKFFVPFVVGIQLITGATASGSIVSGKAFDRIAIFLFENQDYDKSYGDPNFKWFRSKGISLTNYVAATHPSMGNYMASIAGDYFGMDDDDDDMIAPKNVSTVIDLLESKNISWAHYMEDMPYTGFQGGEWKNRKNGRNDYVRKHNPAILHESVTKVPSRLAQVKNMSLTDTSRSEFHKDLTADKLPQWMFITPNMTSDGHDTDVRTSGKWCRYFLEPLLKDPRFTKNTLILLTWDETDTYSGRNKVLGILLGDVIPPDLIGTADDNFYNHYSQISTVSANWNLPTLGRWDVGANVFKWVADKTGDKLRAWESQSEFKKHLWNGSYAGYFNTHAKKRIPKPNLALDKPASGRPILQSIKDMWADSSAPTYYEDTIKVPDDMNPPSGYKP
ncbi:hypothetical protein NQ176_g1718 [Zarea fungicola]|uniref:Uncharacterized protein n=1 Tax=Zarea fungicola TaxID=93591 RepID=A0ACC1NRI2_9HYPO|nr:hypothetical protein NQ176_g1718 [Lecanicillium fungicola]